MAFKRKVEQPVSRLIVGLGNPGSEYRDTRHNLGFMAIDEIAQRLKARVTDNEADALVGRARHPGEPGKSVLLAKPQTFMNLSGRSVARLLDRHHLDVDDLWVVYDEMDLPFGRLRIREGGGPGGHNGVASIIDETRSDGFARFRMGIGRPQSDDHPDFLLSRFTPVESERVPAIVNLLADAVLDGLREGLPVSMNRFNGRDA
jgi:PTH1 family peptidyl-tRNA hydrolase